MGTSSAQARRSAGPPPSTGDAVVGPALLRFATATIPVHIDPAAADAMAPVMRFLRPHVEMGPAGSGSTGPASIEFLPRAAWARPARDGERTLVRRRTPGKHVWGERWRAGGRTVLYVPSSDTALDLADDGGHARVHVSDSSRYHASDLLRDVMWELASPDGTFVHAAAVSDGAGVIAVTGPKGAGKTTTAVDLLHAGCAFFTGDVLFLTGDAAYGFPDYPHVGWGTLRAFPRLLSAVAALGLTPGDDGEKVLLPHDLYRTALDAAHSVPPLPLHTVVVSELGATGPARIEPAGPQAEALARMDRQTSDPGQGWEPFLAALSARAADARAVEVREGDGREGEGRAVEAHTPRAPSGPGQQLRWYARRGTGRLPADQLRALLRRQ